jgi:hypothetical protein
MSPAGAAGTVDVTVTSAGGTSLVNAGDKFTYAVSAPVVTAAPPVAVPTVVAPAIISPLTSYGTNGASFSYTIQTSGDTPTYSASPVPPGLYINTYTGGITGTPTVSGVYTITIGAFNSAGSASATLIMTISDPVIGTGAGSSGSGSSTGGSTPVTSGGTLQAQTITFSQPADLPVGSGAFGLVANATSGLPVSFAIISGPASVSGSMVTLSGQSGTIVIEASQAGNASFMPALAVRMAFHATAAGPRSFFGTLSAASVPMSGAAPQIATGATTMAATVSSSNAAVLVGYIAGLNAGFVANASILADGTFQTTTTTLVAGSGPGQTLTFAGNLNNTNLSGTIQELGISFSMDVDAPTGASSGIAGFGTRLPERPLRPVCFPDAHFLRPGWRHE